MQNQEIVKIIENLKGRRNYEEKRASKLGFASLYDYFEDKISKKQKALEDEQKKLEATKTDNKQKAAKKSCGCCYSKRSRILWIAKIFTGCWFITVTRWNTHTNRYCSMNLRVVS